MPSWIWLPNTCTVMYSKTKLCTSKTGSLWHPASMQSAFCIFGLCVLQCFARKDRCHSNSAFDGSTSGWQARRLDPAADLRYVHQNEFVTRTKETRPVGYLLWADLSISFAQTLEVARAQERLLMWSRLFHSDVGKAASIHRILLILCFWLWQTQKLIISWSADSSDSVDLSESFVLDTGGLCRVRSWDLCVTDVAKDGSFGEKASARGLTFEKSKNG